MKYKNRNCKLSSLWDDLTYYFLDLKIYQKKLYTQTFKIKYWCSQKFLINKEEIRYEITRNVLFERVKKWSKRETNHFIKMRTSVKLQVFKKIFYQKQNSSKISKCKNAPMMKCEWNQVFPFTLKIPNSDN